MEANRCRSNASVDLRPAMKSPTAVDIGVPDLAFKREDLTSTGSILLKSLDARLSRSWGTALIESTNRERTRPKIMYRPICAALTAFLLLSGCTREEGTARLKDDIAPDSLEIIHARFPCRSPGLHFFGYRFRVKVKGESGDGDVCWNFSTRQWTWRILPEYDSGALTLATRDLNEASTRERRARGGTSIGFTLPPTRDRS